MKTRAFWSVRRITFLPNTYWWLCTMPKTGTKNYFSIWEYFLSANGSAPLPDITGWPWCISKKPSPSLDASPRPSVGPLSLKHLNTGGFFNSVVDLLEGFVSLLSPDPLAFLRVRRRSGFRISESFCSNLKRNSTSPINICTAGTSLLSNAQWMTLRFIWIWTSPCLVCSITVSLYYNWNLFSARKFYFCPAYALIVPHFQDLIDPTIICPGGQA